MKILHTSDWHLGSQFCGKKRYDEYDAFLSWLNDCIDQEHIDLLIIAGDIFDTGTPSNRALEQYYQFLARNARNGCRIIVTGGNHDSPTLLNAPKEILKTLNIHVIGSIPDDPEDAVITLSGPDRYPELIVCAIPYLRDRDIRIAEAGESPDEKTLNQVRGICDYYQKICSIAARKRSEIGRDIPIIATGHLFAAGGVTFPGDEMGALSIGSLSRIGTDAFPGCIDYLALGHLHMPQKVFGSDTRRYCGSPLQMDFSGINVQNIIISIEITSPDSTAIKEIPVPAFRRIEQVRGDFDQIEDRLGELIRSGEIVWVEILIDDPRIISPPLERLRELVSRSRVEILKVRNLRLNNQFCMERVPDESLDSLTPTEVFIRCMDSAKISDEQRSALIESFCIILNEIGENDSNAE